MAKTIQKRQKTTPLFLFKRSYILLYVLICNILNQNVDNSNIIVLFLYVLISNFINAEKHFGKTPENLSRYISIFSDCIVHLINFRGVDITQVSPELQQIPLVLTRLFLVRVTIKSSSYTYILPFKKLTSINTTSFTSQIWENISHDLYTNSRRTLIWSKTNHCEAHIYLFLPRPSSKVLFLKTIKYSIVPP